jgi:nicotinamide riboside transporter PnuC
MIETISYIAMALSVAGVLANNRKMKICFYLWIISNIITGGIHLHSGLNGLAVRDAIFTVLAFEGLYRWRK